jgi:LmbE family N-acetylglucosaminyl deacetylase
VLGLRLPPGPLRLACLAAHCDDVEIGAGGTLLRLLDQHPGSTVDWLVLSSTPVRAQEERESAEAFCTNASALDLRIEALPENVMPSLSAEIQRIVGEFAAGGPHDLVLAPSLHDRHQDHRLYVRLDDETVAEKVDLLAKHFPSQHDKQWYDADAFTAILRLRGIECATRHAEGFHVRKTAV